jgi:Dolichyl-phosphate-mannose-protein mannosyltransferase
MSSMSRLSIMLRMSSLLDRISSVVDPRWMAALAIVASCLVHQYRLDAPPNGYHQWRESDTAAITLNYYQEDMTFLHPRVNQRGDSEGITGMEFPLYNYVAALIYHITGPSHAAHRALTILAGSVSLWMMFLIGREMFDPWVGAISSWALAWSPLFLFYSHKIMPDIWMLTYLLISCFAFLKWRNAGSISWLLLSSLALLLSATIKPLGLAVLFPFAYYTHRYRDRRSFVISLFLALLVISAAFAWYQYGQSVNSTHHSAGFDLGNPLDRISENLLSATFFKKLFLQWPWELWIGWALAPLCLVGFYAARHIKDKGVWLWLLGTYLAFAVTPGHSSTHDYYTLSILPLICLFSGLGGTYLWKKHAIVRWAVVTVCLAGPLVTMARISHRISEVPEFESIRHEANIVIPRDARVVVQENTTAIRLYQMNRHGFVIRSNQSIASASFGLSHGATYLVTEREYENLKDSLPQFSFRTQRQLGPLYCYELIVDSLNVEL